MTLWAVSIIGCAALLGVSGGLSMASGDWSYMAWASAGAVGGFTLGVWSRRRW